MLGFTNYVCRTKCVRVYLHLTRNLRGHGRRIRLQEDNSLVHQPVSNKNQPSSQVLLEPLKPAHPSTPVAVFGLTEDKLNKLAADCPPVLLDSPPIQQRPVNPSSSSVRHKNVSTTSSLSERHQLPDSAEEAEPVTAENMHDRIAQCVTPLWKVKYAIQLEEKERRAFDVLKMLKTRLLEVKAPPLPARQGVLPCPLMPIIPSPELLQYRNKDEFVVYRGVDGDPKTVGFLIGHPGHDGTVCVRPTHLITIKDRHKLFCQHFEEFIRGSRHPACGHFRDSCGVWRGAVVRSNRTGELMAVVPIHPHTLLEEEIEELSSDLRSYFVSGAGSEVGITSLYLQVCPHTRCTREQAPYRLLHGEPHITETCSDLQFRLSPDTFLQINTMAAEQLYSTVREVTELSPLTTLLDVCSGTGSISLLLSRSVRGVVGVEAVTSAVEDANSNARHNNITNATFIPGPPEKVLPLLSRELAGCSDVVAVVNPGRGGVHPGVISSLRNNIAISKLLYLSSRPEGYALSNFVSLGSMKLQRQRPLPPPLLPRYAFTVDMFPHTNHYEMGVMFLRERY